MPDKEAKPYQYTNIPVYAETHTRLTALAHELTVKLGRRRRVSFDEALNIILDENDKQKGDQ
jgi:hypothetical protein